MTWDQIKLWLRDHIPSIFWWALVAFFALVDAVHDAWNRTASTIGNIFFLWLDQRLKEWKTLINGYKVAWGVFIAIYKIKWRVFVAERRVDWARFKATFKPLWDTFLEGFKSAWIVFTAILEVKWNYFIAELRVAWAVFKDDFKPLWDAFLDSFIEPWKAFLTTFKALWIVFTATFKAGWNYFVAELRVKWATFLDDFTKPWDTWLEDRKADLNVWLGDRLFDLGLLLGDLIDSAKGVAYGLLVLPMALINRNLDNVAGAVYSWKPPKEKWLTWQDWYLEVQERIDGPEADEKQGLHDLLAWFEIEIAKPPVRPPETYPRR